MRILGLDPGSRVTGFGIVEITGPRKRYLDSGCIRPPLHGSLAGRLAALFEGVTLIIRDHRPLQVAVECVFVHKNPAAALKLGQARGALLTAVATAQLEVWEYAPRVIKQAVVGRGSASKHQVQQMVCALLELPRPPASDAADALAVALCHGHTLQTQRHIAAAIQTRSSPR
ncbi:MAG: crossover junction endodeoxyribonuclease RuvC [Candidatus Competibacterales bacterium]